MDLKTELIALAVRRVSANHNILPNPNSFDSFLSVLFTGKTADVRMAEDIVALADSVTKTARRMNTTRKFRKIISHV